MKNYIPKRINNNPWNRAHIYTVDILPENCPKSEKNYNLERNRPENIKPLIYERKLLPERDHNLPPTSRDIPESHPINRKRDEFIHYRAREGSCGAS